jgi:hypothetical protein
MSNAHKHFSLLQKVVCINDDWTAPDEVPPEGTPKKGEVFTVHGIDGDYLHFLLNGRKRLSFHCSHFAPINVTLSDGDLPQCEGRSIISLETP